MKESPRILTVGLNRRKAFWDIRALGANATLGLKFLWLSLLLEMDARFSFRGDCSSIVGRKSDQSQPLSVPEGSCDSKPSAEKSFVVGQSCALTGEEPEAGTQDKLLFPLSRSQERLEMGVTAVRNPPGGSGWQEVGSALHHGGR